MFEFLLYSGIHCTDAKDVIRRIEASNSVSEIVKAEVIATVKEATPKCKWDAND